MHIGTDDTPLPSLAEPTSTISRQDLLTGTGSRKEFNSVDGGNESVSIMSTDSSVSPQATKLGFQPTFATASPSIDPSMVAQHGSVMYNPLQHKSPPHSSTPRTRQATKLGDWEDTPVNELIIDQIKESKLDGIAEAKNDRIVAVNLDCVCTRGTVIS